MNTTDYGYMEPDGEVNWYDTWNDGKPWTRDEAIEKAFQRYPELREIDIVQLEHGWPSTWNPDPDRFIDDALVDLAGDGDLILPGDDEILETIDPAADVAALKFLRFRLKKAFEVWLQDTRAIVRVARIVSRETVRNPAFDAGPDAA